MKNGCTVIISDSSNKKYILKNLSKEKRLYNLKFYTFLDLKKKLFFDYDNRTVEYVMKNYNVSFKLANIYLENLYYLKDIDNEKIIFLNNLKNTLDKEKLLIYDNSFKEFIRNKRVILYGYSNLTKEQELILKDLSNVEYYKENRKEYKPIVFQLNNLKEEVLYVMNRISKLYLDGIKLNNIKIIVPSDYINTLKFYISVFNIPFNFKKSHSFYSMSIAQAFLKEYDKYNIEEILEKIKDKYDNINELITIINKSVLVSDKRLRKEFIINDLKNTKVKEDNYSNAVEVTSLNDCYNDDDFVFILGFHIGNYPKIFKDDGYLSDKELKYLELDTSIEKNKYEKLNVINKLKNIKNLIITCQKSNDKTIFPSSLIEEMELELKVIENDLTLSYSKLNSKLQYASDLDNLYKFNIVSDNLSLFKNSNLRLGYLEYDNKFSDINIETLKSRIGDELVLSYTNMEMYNECAFKYYISKILRIDSFEENFKTILGTITHHILELGVSKDIDINVEIMKFIKEQNYTLSSKEYFYLNKLSEELTFILEVIKKQEENSALRNYLFESNLNVYLDREDMKITFKGLIDKVMYTNAHEKEIIAVVDYKTGNTSITLENLKYGLNIQLPIYLYLLKNSDRFKDADIAGFYIQKVISSILNIDKKKSLREIKEENLRLQGYSNSSATILELLDKDYQESKMVKGLRFKNDGSFYSTAKILSSKEMEDLTEVVEKQINKCIDDILIGNFTINPKVLKGDNIACEYCKFKDICFKTKKDEVILGGEEDELYRGTVESDN